MTPSRLLSLFALTVLLASSAPVKALEPTPDTGLGPFFPVDLESESDPDLTRVAGQSASPEGYIVEVEGTVRDAGGAPLGGAEVIIWQTDRKGKYRHPREVRRSPGGEQIPEDPAFQYWGKVVTMSDGAYRFRTILPGAYGGRVRHIHFRIRHENHRTLGTELHFQGDPHDGDFVTNEAEHDRLAVPLKPAPGKPGVQRAQFDVVLK